MPVNHANALIFGSACFLTGAALGFSLSLGLPRERGIPLSERSYQTSPELRETSARSLADETAQSNAHIDEEPIQMVELNPGAAALDAAVSIQSLSGLRQKEPGPLVIVPKEMISSLSYAGQVNSLDRELFPEQSELAEHLQIDPTDRTELEAGWKSLRGQIRELEVDAAQYTEMADGSLQVVLPELSARILDLGKVFQARATRTLGPNRAEVLLAAVQFDRVLNDLGEGRKLTVRAEQTGDGGWRYQTVVESPVGKRSFVGENVPQELMHVTGRLQMADYGSDLE